jgi:hypothetical protein
MKLRVLTIAVAGLLFVACSTGAMALTFTDNFSPASSLWSNSTGNWTSSGGTYYAQAPSNGPDTYSGLPFVFTNSNNFLVTVTVNGLSDGGIWLDTDGSINNAILLVLGGNGYGFGSGSSGAGNSIYWHIDQNGAQSAPMAEVQGVFTPGRTYTVSVLVNGKYL